MATVIELIRELKKAIAVVGPNAQVVMQTDTEGNNYSTIHPKQAFQFACKDKDIDKAYESGRADWTKLLYGKEIGVILTPFQEYCSTPEEAVELGKKLK